jgi:S-(hydroxymethyl)glutathione dehydrogenase / alcohol dehydrogenase
MKTTSAVLVETGKPLELAELELPALKPGQVLVDVSFSGVCHTQLLESRGHRGPDKFLPHCLGHEGSGIVRDIGSAVSKVKPGDQVILSWIKGSGADVPGTTYGWNGKTVNSGAITTFSRMTVVSENRLTPLPPGIALRDAAMLGCAIPTGFGVVFNTASPSPGQSLAVFGVGGVGLCAVAAAAIAGCAPVIAIDVLPSKLEVARTVGATHVINASEGDPIAAIKQIVPGGLDFAIESSGRVEVMVQALNAVRNQGGAAVVVGNARAGEKLTFDPLQMNLGKRLLGTWGGDSVPDRDYPRYARLIEAGRINLQPFLSKSYGLAQINDALDDLERGVAIRPIIDMAGA